MSNLELQEADVVRRFVIVIGALALALSTAGCAGWGGGVGGGGSSSINVLMVNNPQMVDLQKLTAANFTKQTGINGQLHRPAGERRPRQDQPGVLQPGRPVRRRVAVSNFEIPIYAHSKWLAPLDSYIAADSAVRPGRHPAVR